MTEKNVMPAEESISKVVLLSSNIGFEPLPSADAEVAQRIALAAHGKVSISRYRYGNGGRHERTAYQRKRIDARLASVVIRQIYETLALGDPQPEVDDAGSWELTVFYRNGEKEKYFGPLMPVEEERLTDLSDEIRELLGYADLFVLDGRVRFDVLERLVLDYQRVTRIAREATAGLEAEVFLWKYTERLRIDRASQTIRLTRRVGARCKITNEYRVQDGVSGILDELEGMGLDGRQESLPDIVTDPDETRDYVLTLTYRKAGKKRMSGSYDRDGLPLAWADHAERLASFLSFYGLSEMLSPGVYNTRARRAGDLMFISVVFNKHEQEYSYLSDDDTIRAGDQVEVPVGPENRRAVTEVVRVSWLPKEEAPVPFEKIKAALGKISD